MAGRSWNKIYSRVCCRDQMKDSCLFVRPVGTHRTSAVDHKLAATVVTIMCVYVEGGNPLQVFKLQLFLPQQDGLSPSFSFRICAADRPLCSLFRSYSDRFVEAGPPKLCTGVRLLSLPNGFPLALTHSLTHTRGHTPCLPAGLFSCWLTGYCPWTLMPAVSDVSVIG